MAVEPASSSAARPTPETIATVRANVERIRERIRQATERAGRDPNRVRLVAISKTFPADRVIAALLAGVEDIGENRVQEATAKIAEVAASGYRPTWHLVGHLQTNKARAAVSHFAIIHSVDSIRLAERIDRLAAGRFPVLLQVNVAREASKTGFLLPRHESPLIIDEEGVSGEELLPAFERISRLEHVEVRGLMTVAPQVPDPEMVRPVFRQLRELAQQLGLAELSMGMSEDFEVAVEEGATLIRLGRAVFGDRATGH